MADVSSTFNSLSSTESSNSPGGSTVIGSGLDENLRMMQAHQAAFRDQTGWGAPLLTSVAGTNTITATLATAGSTTFGPTALASGLRFLLIPANTNTGATTLNITSPNGGSALTAKSVFWGGAACVGGELVAGVPYVVEYDGTQFNVVGGSPALRSGTSQASTSGTSIDFTGIPAWAKQITVQFVGVSTNGSANILIQIGDSGGIESSGYLGASSSFDTAVGTTAFTAGFGLRAASSNNVHHGAVVLTLENASAFTWAARGMTALSNSATTCITAGSKSTSAALDRVRVTTSNGTDAFDAGEINILYE